MLLIYPNVSIFTQNQMKFFSWPKFHKGCWNYQMVPVYSKSMSILPSEAKKYGKIVSVQISRKLFCKSLLRLFCR